MIICLPATFDLTSQQYLEQFHRLTDQINASNVKFIGDAMLNIARRVSDRHFFEIYRPYVQNENFAKLGIAANKEILRLLIEYRSNSKLVDEVSQLLWKHYTNQNTL